MRIDRRFEWNYWKLSYKGKFIRTLCTIPLVVILSVYICYTNNPIHVKTVLILALVVIWAIQLIYNYLRYRST